MKKHQRNADEKQIHIVVDDKTYALIEQIEDVSGLARTDIVRLALRKYAKTILKMLSP